MEYNNIKKYGLNDKIVVVCGGFGLIGKSICEFLYLEGARIVVMDKVKGNLDIPFHYIKFDVTDFKSYEDKLNKVLRDFDKIDIWVNASYPRTKDWGKELDENNVDSFRRNIDMQLNSYCILTRTVAELMKTEGIHGSIINFSSIYGLISPHPDNYKDTDMFSPSAYCAIKGGIINYTKYIAAYYGKDGIRANCIASGGVISHTQDQKFIDRYINKTALKCMAEPVDLARVVFFLSSDLSTYVTGHNLVVDGGYTLT